MLGGRSGPPLHERLRGVLRPPGTGSSRRGATCSNQIRQSGDFASDASDSDASDALTPLWSYG